MPNDRKKDLCEQPITCRDLFFLPGQQLDPPKTPSSKKDHRKTIPGHRSTCFKYATHVCLCFDTSAPRQGGRGRRDSVWLRVDSSRRREPLRSRGAWVLGFAPVPAISKLYRVAAECMFSMPAGVRVDGGNIPLVTPVAEGTYWRLPLTGAKSYSWPVTSKDE
jgi:hypothetical protein